MGISNITCTVTVNRATRGSTCSATLRNDTKKSSGNRRNSSASCSNSCCSSVGCSVGEVRDAGSDGVADVATVETAVFDPFTDDAAAFALGEAFRRWGPLFRSSSGSILLSSDDMAEKLFRIPTVRHRADKNPDVSGW